MADIAAALHRLRLGQHGILFAARTCRFPNSTEFFERAHLVPTLCIFAGFQHEQGNLRLWDQ